MAFKNVAMAIAMAGYAAAQSSTNVCQPTGTMTISSQGDAGAIAGCTTFSGTIAVATGVTAPLSLDGIQTITGDLIVENVIGLPSFEAGNLASIEGTFSLINMTLLTSLSMPQLSIVNTIEWITLPRLQSLSFNKGVTNATAVNIFDSALGSLSGLNLESVSEMTISNNGQLTEVDLPITSINTGLAIEFNGQTMDVSFPNLENAFNLTFRNVSSLSMPGLGQVNQSVGFYGCTFDNISLPNLTSVGGSITFVGNNDVTNITMPELTSITGALFLSANPMLDTVNGFPLLKTIEGAIDMSGNFSSVSLPALSFVQGAVNIQSTADISQTCNNFQKLGTQVIKGKLTCTSTPSPSASSSTTPGAGGSGSGSGSSSQTSTHKGAASPELYARSSAVTGVLGIFAALLGML